MVKVKLDGKVDKCKRVAIFITYKNIESSASLINFIKSLSRKGYIVDVFSPDSFKEIFNPGYENINFYSDKGFDARGKHKNIKQILNLDLIGCFFSKLHRSVKLHDIKSCVVYAIFIVRRLKRLLYHNYICSIIKSKRYICFIGVERMGLIVADLVNYNEVPLIYYSLELYYSPPPGILPRFAFNAYRGLEVIAHSNAIATIIQDEERAKVLFGYNKVPSNKQEILYLPVSMLGDSFKERTDFFYETLGIPRDKKILLQLGMIGSERMSVEIAKSAQNWHEDWVLVMHGNFNEGIEHQIRKLNKRGNIYLSEKKVPPGDIPKVVASAHIGLVFYKNLINSNYYNNYYMGSSSGQLAHHLQCGIPIITLNIPSLRRVVDGCQCGLAVDDADSIAESAKIIFNNYEFFRENAFKCFEERYRFEKHFENISKFIESLT
jgi:glycosyltransferase involved in cell wall biosynthesis